MLVMALITLVQGGMLVLMAWQLPSSKNSSTLWGKNTQLQHPPPLPAPQLHKGWWTGCKYSIVADVKQLPPVWAAIAKCPFKDKRDILQAALDNHLHSPGASTNAKLTVSKELLSTVVNLALWSGNFNMLEEGLHPFCTVYVSTAKQAQDQAHLQTYDTLAREGNLRLEDIQLFQLVLKLHWPSEYLQLDTTLS